MVKSNLLLHPLYVAAFIDAARIFPAKFPHFSRHSIGFKVYDDMIAGGIMLCKQMGGEFSSDDLGILTPALTQLLMESSPYESHSVSFVIGKASKYVPIERKKRVN